MQSSRALILALVGRSHASSDADKTKNNPMASVLSLIEELAAKVTKDGENEAKAYKEYFEWCDDVSKNTDYAIETAQNEKAKLEAKIGELSSTISAAGSNIETLAASIATSEKELNDATVVRKKEAADFTSSEAELMEAIDTLTRAIGILEKEMAKNPASFAQYNSKSMANALQALSAVLDAAAFNGKDQSKLQAFVQSQQGDESDDLELGAPSAAAYKSRSGGIVDTLEDLKEKAEGQLSDLRKAEVNTNHNFAMLKQSLEDQKGADTKDMEEEKSNRAAAQEGKATAEGDLGMTSKELASSKSELATAHDTCLQVASDHEATEAARTEELATIAKAKTILEATSSGAVSQTYSFAQVETGALQGLRIHTKSDLAGSEVVVAVKRLAKKHHSAALAQLASRIATVLRFSTSAGEDPFAKVKGLITEMIAKLEKEAGSEAQEKAYCDEQMSKTEVKKSELEEDIAKMTSRIDQATAKSAQLKEEIQALESELAALTRSQAEMDKIRQESHADYKQAKADLELGLSGVRKALGVLRDYYGGAASSMIQDDNSFGAYMQQPAKPETHSQASGAGSSIINILEVCESDFAKNLAKEETEEADSQAEYEKVSQENAVTKTTKEQDVVYKTKESKSLDKTASEYSSDRETENTELSAVLEYYTKIKDRCIAKPETYSERKERRTAEIQGLKEALSILEDETALVQRKKHSGRSHAFLAA